MVVSQYFTGCVDHQILFLCSPPSSWCNSLIEVSTWLGETSSALHALVYDSIPIGILSSLSFVFRSSEQFTFVFPAAAILCNAWQWNAIKADRKPIKPPVRQMARRAMSLLPQWSSRVFSVELDGASFYFSIQEKHRGGAIPRLFEAVQSCGRCYSLLVCSSDRIRRAKLHAELKEKLIRALPPECDASPMSSFLPNVKDSLIKGYFLKDFSASPVASEQLLRDLTRHDPVLVCSYMRVEGDQVWTQHLWPCEDSQAMELSEEYYVVHTEAPQYHPSTLNIINSDVFYNFEEARQVIQQVLTHNPVLQ